MNFIWEISGRVLLLAFCGLNAAAAVRTWDGSANGNLSTAANWQEGIAPVAAYARFAVVVSQREASPDLSRYRLDVTGGSCRPTLDIHPSPPNETVLSWSTAAAGYELERAHTLAAPPPWAPLPASPITINSRLNLAVPATNRDFYRLRRP